MGKIFDTSPIFDCLVMDTWLKWLWLDCVKYSLSVQSNLPDFSLLAMVSRYQTYATICPERNPQAGFPDTEQMLHGCTSNLVVRYLHGFGKGSYKIGLGRRRPCGIAISMAHCNPHDNSRLAVLAMHIATMLRSWLMAETTQPIRQMVPLN